MVSIPLTRGQHALIDDSDFDLVSAFKWQYWHDGKRKTGYATRNRRNLPNDGSPSVSKMHNLIMQPPKGLYVDHINGNGLDNRRENLRIVTHAENCRNRSLRSDSTSGIPGVGWNCTLGKWGVRLQYEGKRHFFGWFSTFEEAKEAHRSARESLYGIG